MGTVYMAVSLSSLSCPTTEKLHFCMSDKLTTTIVTACIILIHSDQTMATLCAVVKEYVKQQTLP